MYAPETILVLKKPKPDVEVEARIDPDNPDRKRPASKHPFPYNRVKVIGESPVDHSGGAGGTWSGVGARGVIITPLSGHGSTLDEPFGKLQQLYKVESEPPTEVEYVPVRVVRGGTAQAGPTPEEVFAKESPPAPPGSKRGRTPRSPLGEVTPPSAKGPLDE